MKKLNFLIIFSFISFLMAFTQNLEEEITMGFLGDKDGPLSFWNEPRVVGMLDAAEYINSNGGIAGRKVRVEVRDHSSSVEKAQKGYSELVKLSDIIWGTCGSTEQKALKHKVETNKDKVFFTCLTGPGIVYPTGHIFGGAPYYADQFGAFLDYLIENWKRERRPRVAFMTYDTGYGKAHITRETISYAEKLGVDIVGKVYIPFETDDPLPYLKELELYKPDYVYGQGLWKTLPPYLLANKKHKFDFKFVVNNFGVDPLLVEMSKDASNGLLGISSWYLANENTKGIKIAKKVLKEKNRKQRYQGTAYLWGWMNLYFMKTVYEELLELPEVNGDFNKINSELMVKHLEKWNNKDIFGFGLLQYSETQRAPHLYRIVSVIDQNWVPLTDWKKTPDLVKPSWKKPIYK